MDRLHVAHGSRQFRVLMVCTGNICRSPFAEILFRHLLVGRLGGRWASRFEVSSAGVRAMVGAQMHPYTRDELMPWGLDGIQAGRFAARQVCPELVRRSDLVLGANPGHRSAVLEYVPEALPITFGLREFARLARVVDLAELPDDPVERALRLVERARASRGLAPPDSPEADLIPDPMGDDPRAHHGAAVLIRDAVEQIVELIAPLRQVAVDHGGTA